MTEETPYCPTCGQPTTFRTSPEWLLGHWGGKYVGILAALIDARRHRRGLSIEELARAATMNHPQPQGTSTSTGTVRVLLSNNRKQLRKLGWEILGPAVTKNGFWLVPVEDS